MTTRILILGFVLSTIALVYWLFASWYVYSMADFDCLDRAVDQLVCQRAIRAPIEMRVLALLSVWLVAACVFAWNWKKR